MADKKDNREELIRDAQYRKGASIAYFNSLNSAIALVTASITSFINEEDMLSKIDEYKNIFINQHDEYYKQVIANIGATESTSSYVAKLQSVDTIDDLKKVWLLLPQDARSNKEVHDIALQMKAKLTK